MTAARWRHGFLAAMVVLSSSLGAADVHAALMVPQSWKTTGLLHPRGQ
jgi:hypothetical protein